MQNNDKELEINLWDAVVYLKLSFLKNSSFKNFQRRIRIFENEKPWN